MTDVVIAWVDGDDIVHKQKKATFLTPGKEAAFDDIAGDARYKQTGEIYYCVASILRYAPWVRKIFIVTDAQNPHVDEFVGRNFPDNRIPIEIVDHKVLFRGYEQYLPTFNSLAISTMLWRIPGISDSFLYFNDDVFLTAPVDESVWFREDKTILYASKFPAMWARFLRWAKHIGKSHKTFGHKDPMLNAARILRSNMFYLFPHAPVPMRRSWYENFYTANSDLLDNNIRYRFREPSQFSSPTLFYLSAAREGKLEVRSPKGLCCFLKPSATKKEKGYMARKLAEMDANPCLLFGCINSMSEASNDEQQMFHRWISHRLQVSL